MYIASEVLTALTESRPVVALESTLITHGLPYPVNVETALAMEDAVRESGAVPATIAILEGKITVGLSAAQVEQLAAMPGEEVRKCSRRDLAVAVALREYGATTVAGTMLIAHMAGIHVFATGGIGGVHRGHPFDVSADLMELGRTPVTVVCSGAKSILDLPLTLEVLETQGIPVIGYGTRTLPAFYARSSGLPLDVCIETPDQAAQIMRAADEMRLTHGILITVPVPEGFEMNEADAETAIVQATAEAEAAGIVGKAVSPFVLSRVAAITEGHSQRANTALLVNNARVGGQIASAFCAIRKPS
ncbi:MAG: pseudouridine-5-phosphate glycosidase [Phototrophicales bacterium]|nr:MAG: pseudouridine-5-phosphate glycosidase [Phototrophicales bacterium]